jgi:hypothetical protein
MDKVVEFKKKKRQTYYEKILTFGQSSDVSHDSY